MSILTESDTGPPGQQEQPDIDSRFLSQPSEIILESRRFALGQETGGIDDGGESEGGLPARSIPRVVGGRGAVMRAGGRAAGQQVPAQQEDDRTPQIEPHLSPAGEVA
jgi:hypothetical protein